MFAHTSRAVCPANEGIETVLTEILVGTLHDLSRGLPR